MVISFLVTAPCHMFNFQFEQKLLEHLLVRWRTTTTTLCYVDWETVEPRKMNKEKGERKRILSLVWFFCLYWFDGDANATGECGDGDDDKRNAWNEMSNEKLKFHLSLSSQNILMQKWHIDAPTTSIDIRHATQTHTHSACKCFWICHWLYRPTLLCS